MRPHLSGLRHSGGLVDFETPQKHHWTGLVRLDFAQAWHDLRAEKLNGTVPLVKAKPQIENDMIDADFEKFSDLIDDVLRTSSDEGTLQIFRRSKRTRSGLHPEFLLVGVREQSVEVDLFNGCLAVLVNACDRNAAFMQARPALSSRRAAKFFYALAIGGHSDPAGQPAITVFHRAAYRGRCGISEPKPSLTLVVAAPSVARTTNGSMKVLSVPSIPWGWNTRWSLTQTESKAICSARRAPPMILSRSVSGPKCGKSKPYSVAMIKSLQRFPCDVNCRMACCAMSNVFGAITKPPNDHLVNGSFGNLVIETR